MNEMNYLFLISEKKELKQRAIIKFQSLDANKDGL